MKRKKKTKYKKVIITVILIIVIFLLLYFFINDNEKKNFFTDSLKEISADISKLTIKENTKDSSNLINEINKDYENEINNLKKTLDLNTLNSDKTFINSTVIKRSTKYWYDTITIDKGKKDNIKVGDAVINSEGLIGKIIKVNNKSSDIKLLISSSRNNYVSASFSYEDNQYYGIIDSYDSNKNELTLKDVIGTFDINKLKGINVITSGLSDSFSSGLLIGTIKAAKKDTYGLSYVITLTPSVNFNNINIVSVVKGV